MYERHFGFRERPFSLLPDPAFLYHGRKHALALASLEYGLLNCSPIILVTGEIGSGKTTLIRHLLNQLPEQTAIGLISHTHRAFGDLMQLVCAAFGIEHEGREKVSLYRAFVDFLVEHYARGRRSVLIVDEAQNMDVDVLEELRVMSNINADKDLVLQLVIVGQPELREMLRQPVLEQFAQRIAVDYHLDPLDARETREYIAHRLTVAGGTPGSFSRDAVAAIHDYAVGVPRLINALCDAALVYAYAEGRHRVSAKLVHELVEERRRRGLFGAGKIDYSATGEASV
ncbi:MAG: ExeA family protein [Vicinamibacterales bacterium]